MCNILALHALRGWQLLPWLESRPAVPSQPVGASELAIKASNGQNVVGDERCARSYRAVAGVQFGGRHGAAVGGGQRPLCARLAARRACGLRRLVPQPGTAHPFRCRGQDGGAGLVRCGMSVLRPDLSSHSAPCPAQDPAILHVCTPCCFQFASETVTDGADVYPPVADTSAQSIHGRVWYMQGWAMKRLRRQRPQRCS